MKNGELFLTDRIRTSSSRQATAKYIAPQMVEAMLLVDKFIDQVAVIAMSASSSPHSGWCPNSVCLKSMHAPTA